MIKRLCDICGLEMDDDVVVVVKGDSSDARLTIKTECVVGNYANEIDACIGCVKTMLMKMFGGEPASSIASIDTLKQLIADGNSLCLPGFKTVIVFEDEEVAVMQGGNSTFVASLCSSHIAQVKTPLTMTELRKLLFDWSIE